LPSAGWTARLSDCALPDLEFHRRPGGRPEPKPTAFHADITTNLLQESVPMNPCTADPSDDIAYPSAIAFLLVHLACFAAFWTGVTGTALLLGVGL